MIHSIRLDHDPDFLALHKANPAEFPVLLETTAEGDSRAGWDILFAYPQRSLLAYADRVEFSDGTRASGDFLSALGRWFASERGNESPSPWPFAGGWFLYLGYEMAREIEPRVALTLPPITQPIACAMRVPAALLRDRGTGAVYAVAEASATALLNRLRAAVDTAATPPAREVVPAPAPTREVIAAPTREEITAPALVHEENPARFLDGVARIKNYIEAGDVFQVNLSRLWQGTLPSGVTPADVYRRLRDANPAPFSGVAMLPGLALASSSPERLVCARDGWVETRPIAGTRPRGASAADDVAQWQTLLRHPKERAEHIMLIDLERNDLGRVCQVGTVEVNEQMVVESYRHVHHIVSNVRGRLRADVTPAEVIRAVFPGGTITGCPKVRCMEIIAELEQAPRGPYTGAMGYLTSNGEMDLNILIRTAWFRDQQWFVRAGAGIVADSVAAAELAETRAKARGVLSAFGVEPDHG